MVLMFLAWTIVSSVYEKTQDVQSAGYPQVVFVWLFSVFYAIAWSGLLVAYALEILPYRLRAKGIMIMNLTVQATLVLGKYVLESNTLLMARLTQSVTRTRSRGRTCLIIGTSHSSTPFGSSLSSCSFISSTWKPVVPLWRNWPRSSMARMRPWHMLISSKSKRRYTLPRKRRLVIANASFDAVL